MSRGIDSCGTSHVVLRARPTSKIRSVNHRDNSLSLHPSQEVCHYTRQSTFENNSHESTLQEKPLAIGGAPQMRRPEILRNFGEPSEDLEVVDSAAHRREIAHEKYRPSAPRAKAAGSEFSEVLSIGYDRLDLITSNLKDAVVPLRAGGQKWAQELGVNSTGRRASNPFSCPQRSSPLPARRRGPYRVYR